MHEQHWGGLLRYFKKINKYKKEFEEKSIDYLQGRNDQYEETFRAKFRRKFKILGTPSKIVAIQNILEERVKSEIIKQGKK